ncbi:hypothetical protein ACSBR2_003920 [Camellia fascicularis]
MWAAGACTALSVWFNNMYEMFKNGENLPQLATVVVVRGQMEKSSITRDFPVASATYSYLIDNVPPSFRVPGWNKGRIIRQQSQLNRFLSDTEPSSDGSKKDKLITLSNTPFPRSGDENNHS